VLHMTMTDFWDAVSKRLQGAISQNTAVFIVAAVRTLNLSVRVCFEFEFIYIL
jgi:hypothetical protein